jgi:hypothetical protein
MGEVRPIPTLGGVVRDVRGAGRALRVSWHGEAGLVVLSLWDGPRCTGTVRIAASDVPTLLEALQIGLPPEPAEPPAGATPQSPDDRTPGPGDPPEGTTFQPVPPAADGTPEPVTPPVDETPAPPSRLDVVTDPEDGAAD